MSLNLVNKTTGDLTPVAGVSTDKVGNLSALTTTDKSSAVGAINEVNNKVIFRGTLTGSVLQTAKDLPDNVVCVYKNSNNPTDKPSSISYGCYNFFKSNGMCSIICHDNSHFACAYGIEDSTSAITWFDDTGWTQIEATGVTGDARVEIYYRKIGNVVSVKGILRNSQDSNWTTKATLPLGFRPYLYSLYRCILYDSNTSFRNLYISTNGEIKVRGSADVEFEESFLIG